MSCELTGAERTADALSWQIVDTEPDLNRTAIRQALAAFLTWRGSHELTLPGRSELASYLAERQDACGEAAACTDFAYLQIAAARIWGAAQTSHFAVVLRKARVAPKPPKADEWKKAELAISRLPAEWQEPMRHHLKLSRAGGKEARRIERWSASHLQAVAHALAGWKAFCGASDRNEVPTGSALEAYGQSLNKKAKDPVSTSSVAHYLARIYTGFSTVLWPGFASEACEFVLRDWRERGDLEGTPTKTADQLVSATAIFDLGFRLIEQARARRTRGMRAALDFRNGLLLATAIALPQRARALSVLEFGRTLTLIGQDTLHVRIPGRALKQREHLKADQPYDKVFRSVRLAAALAEYAANYRPIFDEGDLLFPSFHAPLQGLSEWQLGQLAGRLTFDAFKVRVTIHRFRDNVATEVCETMEQGGRLAPALLGHHDVATVGRFYDHSEGFLAASEYGDHLDARRTAPTDLLV